MSDPAPSDPAPSDPAPSDPAPSDPAPTDPPMGEKDQGPSSEVSGTEAAAKKKQNDADERRRFRLAAAATARSLNQWPLVLVLAALAASFCIVATGHWRKGAFAVGCSVVLAGLLRAVLPAKTVGLLAVRARWFDVVLLLLCGGAMLALTLVVPHSSPRIQ